MFCIMIDSCKNVGKEARADGIFYRLVICPRRNAESAAPNWMYKVVWKFFFDMVIGGDLFLSHSFLPSFPRRAKPKEQRVMESGNIA